MYLLLEKWKDFVERRSISEMKVLPAASLLHFNSHSWEKYQTGLAEKKERKKTQQQHKSILLWKWRPECIALDACEKTQRSLWWISFGYWFPSISMAPTVTPFFHSIADQNSLGHWSWLILKNSKSWNHQHYKNKNTWKLSIIFVNYADYAFVLIWGTKNINGSLNEHMTINQRRMPESPAGSLEVR